MKRILLDLRLVLKSPFLFPDVAAGAFGLDKVALRDRQGRAIIAQEQVRGVLLHASHDALQAMQKKQGIRFDIFGQATAEARPETDDPTRLPADFLPRRGRVQFSDLVMQQDITSKRAVRVQIDPELGAAEEGKLMFAELVAPLGFEVEFKGTAVLLADDQEAAEWLPVLSAAATWVSAIGSMKSAGYGEVVSFSVEERAQQPLRPTRTVQPSERQGYAMTFDRPFLVDTRRAADNIYVGQGVVPGGVIKGALAHKVMLCGLMDKLGPALSAMTVSHAQRTKSGPKVPLSMVVDPDTNTVGDALQLPMGRGALIDGRPAQWGPDWKDAAKSAVRGAMGFDPELRFLRCLRTHVAINQETGGAESGKLFVIDAVDPGPDSWHFVVDYAQVLDPSQREVLATMLEDGLDGIGRTGASARIAQCEAVSVLPVVPIIGASDRFAVVLESDAVMASPDDGGDAFEAYARWWERVLPGATLVGFSASQRLAGGYLARRFKSGQSYTPFWLTEGGSVFCLQGDIKKALEKMVASGLPAPVIGGTVTTWETCPFQPENGYGAIRCDHDGRFCGVVDHG